MDARRILQRLNGCHVWRSEAEIVLFRVVTRMREDPRIKSSINTIATLHQNAMFPSFNEVVVK
jgi:hypothetical protein